jgi:RNA polymerase sigma-70 factor, ECF subfamily
MRRKRSPSTPGGELSPTAAPLAQTLSKLSLERIKARRSAEGGPGSWPNAVTYPTPEELLSEAPTIRRWLRRHGVPPVDMDDLVAEVIAAAWRSIDRGRFKPDPTLAPRTALHIWIWAVTWRRSSATLRRAHRKHEVLVAQTPLGSAQSPEPCLLARDELALLSAIKPRRRAVLLAHAAGITIPEIAAAMGANISTTWSRLRQGRLDLLALLRREAAKVR